MLVGTRKGAFILTSLGVRDKWDISGPLFNGWEILHIKGSKADADRIYASQSSETLEQAIQRSKDGGRTWQAVGNKFAYADAEGARASKFKRVCHLEPSPGDPDTVYAGVEEAALFRTSDGGQTWEELPGLRRQKSAASWKAGADGLGLHTIVIDLKHGGRRFAAISDVGAFRTDDDGSAWHEIGQGIADIAMHWKRPDVLFGQARGEVLRSDDAGESWHKVSGKLPAAAGFSINIHALEPDTVYVVPISGDSERASPDGKLCVYRSRNGGNDWEPLTAGLPQQDSHETVSRGATAVDTLDPCGIYFGTSGGQVYASKDAGDHWTAIARGLPPVLSVEAQKITIAW